MQRRAFLAHLGAFGLGSAAFGDPLLTSLRPRVRPISGSNLTALISRSQLSGIVGFHAQFLDTGEVIASANGDTPLPPASVAKAATALYGLETLGADYQFETRLIADGTISGGVLNGDLVLAGTGDPELVTDELAELARRLKQAGIHKVLGRFLVWGGALSQVSEIDADQLDHVAYNPSVGGLNLNQNRVHFTWQRGAEDYQTRMDAPGFQFQPIVKTSEIEIVDRDTPVFAYAQDGAIDAWSVARGALGDDGGRWLPVRNPALYAGEVFAILARGQGIEIADPTRARARPDGISLVSIKSAPLRDILRRMLRESINLTAEAVGLSATRALAGRTLPLQASANVMNRWMEVRCTTAQPAFVDHSGLGDRSRVSPAQMVALLTAHGARDQLWPILREIGMADDDGQTALKGPVKLHAKTGTLNFVSGLSGYLTTQAGRDVAFAFFAADASARAAGKLTGQEVPRGARTFANRARNLQFKILREIAKGRLD